MNIQSNSNTNLLLNGLSSLLKVGNILHRMLGPEVCDHPWGRTLWSLNFCLAGLISHTNNNCSIIIGIFKMVPQMGIPLGYFTPLWPGGISWCLCCRPFTTFGSLLGASCGWNIDLLLILWVRNVPTITGTLRHDFRTLSNSITVFKQVQIIPDNFQTRAKKKTSDHCNLLKPIVQVCTLSRNGISSITLNKKFELNRSQSGKSINDQILPRMTQTNTR